MFFTFLLTVLLSHCFYISWLVEINTWVCLWNECLISVHCFCRILQVQHLHMSWSELCLWLLASDWITESQQHTMRCGLSPPAFVTMLSEVLCTGKNHHHGRPIWESRREESLNKHLLNWKNILLKPNFFFNKMQIPLIKILLKKSFFF